MRIILTLIITTKKKLDDNINQFLIRVICNWSENVSHSLIDKHLHSSILNQLLITMISAITDKKPTSSPVNVVVDLEGSYRTRAFLRALEESVLVKKEYHYVFSNFVSYQIINNQQKIDNWFFCRTSMKPTFLDSIFPLSISQFFGFLIRITRDFCEFSLSLISDKISDNWFFQEITCRIPWCLSGRLLEYW